MLFSTVTRRGGEERKTSFRRNSRRALRAFMEHLLYTERRVGVHGGLPCDEQLAWFGLESPPGPGVYWVFSGKSKHTARWGGHTRPADQRDLLWWPCSLPGAPITPPSGVFPGGPDASALLHATSHSCDLPAALNSSVPRSLHLDDQAKIPPILQVGDPRPRGSVGAGKEQPVFFPLKELSAAWVLPTNCHVLMAKPLMGKNHLMELNAICCINLNQRLSNLFFLSLQNICMTHTLTQKPSAYRRQNRRPPT